MSRRHEAGAATVLVIALLGVLATPAAGWPRFLNRLTAPPTPEKIQFGSDLRLDAAALLGNFEGDAEFWDLFYRAAAGVGLEPATAPVDGWLTGVYVKGRAVSGDMPGPGGSQPFRVGIEEPLPDGRLQVLSTSNPPFQLPGTNGTYYYWIGPPYTGFRMPLKKGQYVSFDTRGGTFAVFGSSPGSTSASTVGKGQEQNAGVIWTPTQHPDVELLIRMVEQPKVPTTKLEAATAPIAKALALEQEAEGVTGKASNASLKSSVRELKTARKLVHEAGEPKQGEISHDTELSIDHYLRTALTEDKAAASRKKQQDRTARIKAAIEAKRTGLSDIRRAKSLARQVR